MKAHVIAKRVQLPASVLVATVLSANALWAQEKFPIDATSEGVKSRYVQQYVIDVGDIAGHQVRILELHRIHSTKQIEVAGVKVVEEWARGYSDYTNGVGPAKGYGIWILEDGNKVFVEWNGTANTKPTATGSKRGTFHGTTKIVGGTGKFSSIRGTLTGVVEFDTDPQGGYNRESNTGEYWFEK